MLDSLEQFLVVASLLFDPFAQRLALSPIAERAVLATVFGRQLLGKLLLPFVELASPVAQFAHLLGKLVGRPLTELFAPKIHKERIAGMLENYDFIDDKVMAYFKRRLTQAPRDADFALQYVLTNAKTRDEQEACIDAVRFKCNVLWVQLDALYHAYVNGNVPPGAFRPEA